MLGLFNKDFDPQVLITTMMGTVNDLFDRMCSEQFTSDPKVVTREITMIDLGKMNVEIDLPYKFHSKSYVSAINYFKSDKDMERIKPCGFIIVYIKQSCLIDLARSFGFSVNVKKSDTFADSCGELANMIAGEFKNKIVKIGYVELLSSAPTSGRWTLRDGIDYPEGLRKYHELSFYLFNTKALVVDVGLANIPHS